MSKRLGDLVITAWMWIFVPLLTVAVTLPIAFCSVILAPFDPQRRMAHEIASLWARLILRANPFWKLEVEGWKNVHPAKGYVIVSNHSSVADIIVLFCLGLQFKWLAKRSLFAIPFFGWNMSFIQYIPLERGHTGSIRSSYAKAKDWLARGMSVLIFPEGTRSRDGKVGEFKNGAFKLALEIKKPILPIAIAGNRNPLAKGRKMISATVRTHVSILPPVDISRYGLGDFETLKSAVCSLIQKDIASHTKPAA